MNGLLVDVNLRREREVLLSLFLQPKRIELWQYLACIMPTFDEVGLADNSSDLIVWRKCQDRNLVLVTGNRNDKGKDSLESVLRTFNQPENLPVLTISTPDRFLPDSDYKHRVADRILEYLFDIDRFRGVGRLYVP